MRFLELFNLKILADYTDFADLNIEENLLISKICERYYLKFIHSIPSLVFQHLKFPAAKFL